MLMQCPIIHFLVWDRTTVHECFSSVHLQPKLLFSPSTWQKTISFNHSDSGSPLLYLPSFTFGFLLFFEEWCAENWLTKYSLCRFSETPLLLEPGILGSFVLYLFPFEKVLLTLHDMKGDLSKCSPSERLIHCDFLFEKIRVINSLCWIFLCIYAVTFIVSYGNHQHGNLPCVRWMVWWKCPAS